MANPINFIQMIPAATRSGNSDPKYLNERRAIESDLLMFTHTIKGSMPGDVAAGEALASSIKAASLIVYDAEARLDTISKLEALKVGYAPPITLIEKAKIERLGLRPPVNTSKIKNPAMLNELDQFISGYKSKYPEPDGYSGIKSKLASDIGKLKNLMEKMRASWSGGGAGTTAAGTTVAATTQLAKPSPNKKPKKKPIPKPKGRR